MLPLAWPALHRNGGELFVATQSGATSGDPSRDLAAALLLAADADEGTPVTAVPNPTVDTPRLQDILDTTAPFDVTVHEGFDFWVGDSGPRRGRPASRSSAPTSPSSRPSASSTASSVYWCVINGRTYVRWVLPYDEDTATAALARLHAADSDRLTPESRLLGAFRACGLLVPVWEVPADTTAGDYPDAVEAMGAALSSAAADDTPLTADERRARAGLLNRQVTLR